MTDTNFSMDEIVSLCKRKGFIFPGSDIYGGFGNSYTYGPLGVELKKNIKDLWWKTFIQDRDDMVGIDGDIILHPNTWHASGHVSGFNDPLVECMETNKRFRADHIIEEQTGIDPEGLPLDEMTKIIREEQVVSPATRKPTLGPVRNFSQMFSTKMAKTSDGGDDIAYLRPETAQAIFLEFKNVTDSTRVKIPFGIGQIGKAFRNEITPGNFIFRRLEFEQMEIEYFIAPPEGFDENRDAFMDKVEGVDGWPTKPKEHLLGHFNQWLEAQKAWCELIGLDASKCHLKEHAPEKLSHYSLKTIDIEFDFPFGRKELYGCAYRTDFDLKQHEKHSGKKLRFRDPQTNKEYVPHVIEPTWGLDRSVLAVLCSAYEVELLEDGTSRTVIHFKPSIAPTKIAILPLVKKDGLPEKSKELQKMLQLFGRVEYDDGGAIGKRYRRQDEAGTPVCITIDYDTLEDQAVTVRDRDTMQQERVAISDLLSYLNEGYFKS